MHDFMLILCAFAVVAWLYLAFAHKKFWIPLLPRAVADADVWPSIDIIVPARNEAEAMPVAMPALLAQEYPGAWKVILVDDHSTDGTAAIAASVAQDMDAEARLEIVVAPKLVEGWSGKVAAMNAGLAHSRAEYVLFTDADIRHPPHSLRDLAARAVGGKLDLVTRMVRLNCESFAEKLLIPAFVFFFAMLYPFRAANDPRSKVAAAAGGTMLVRRELLDAAGGLARIKNALIDDCSLARLIKNAGGSTELTLSDDIDSLRAYPVIEDVWHMVARTAYTQLRYSPLLLTGTLLGLAWLYLVPPLAFFFSSGAETVFLGLCAWVLSAVLYLPTVRFYRLGAAWALTLPLSALVYGAATFDSARLYHLGKGGQWKGRAQA